MKSYALSIAVAMLISAVYAFQNSGNILVRFLMFERLIPQGLWDVLLFSAGAVFMWLVSICGTFEIMGKYRRQVKEKDARIKELEEEKKSLLQLRPIEAACHMDEPGRAGMPDMGTEKGEQTAS